MGVATSSHGTIAGLSSITEMVAERHIPSLGYPPPQGVERGLVCTFCQAQFVIINNAVLEILLCWWYLSLLALRALSWKGRDVDGRGGGPALASGAFGCSIGQDWWSLSGGVLTELGQRQTLDPHYNQQMWQIN